MKLGFEIDMVSKTDFPGNHTKIFSKNIIMPLNNLMIPYEIFFLINYHYIWHYTDVTKVTKNFFYAINNIWKKITVNFVIKWSCVIMNH